MNELNRLLTVMRKEDDEQDALSVQPRLEDLPRLVELAKAAGQDVQLDLNGEPGRLDPSVALACYRVVQEALTNARKYAGQSLVRINLSWLPPRLVVTVSNDAGLAPGDDEAAAADPFDRDGAARAGQDRDLDQLRPPRDEQLHRRAVGRAAPRLRFGVDDVAFRHLALGRDIQRREGVYARARDERGDRDHAPAGPVLVRRDPRARSLTGHVHRLPNRRGNKDAAVEPAKAGALVQGSGDDVGLA